MGEQDQTKKQPDTYREIMHSELKKRKKLSMESELEQINLSPNQVVEMLARTLASEENQGSSPDIDTKLNPTSVSRILSNTLGLSKIIRSELGPLRRERIEDEARAILLQEGSLSEAEVHSAVRAIDSHDRRDIAGSFTRTINECALHLAELARAHHDRQQAAAEPPRPVILQTEAQLHGPATAAMFYRAVDPAIGDAEIASIVGPALAQLPAMDARLRHPKALTPQLASRKLLHAGQEGQLEAEVSARRHYPFGLIQPRSLAILTAAVYLVRGQVSDGLIRAAREQYLTAQDPAMLFTRTFNHLSSEINRKSESDNDKGWDTFYDATPGALDCLRVAVPLITVDKVPDFLRVPPPPSPFPDHDPAYRLLAAALPLDEQSKSPWAQSHWNPLGQRLLHRINKEHYKQISNSLFHGGEFEATAGRLPGLILTELVRRLQRKEGLENGLPNTRKVYLHSSILSLNKFLTAVSDRHFENVFMAYRSALLNRGVDIREGSAEPQEFDPAIAVNIPGDFPQGVALLTMESVRASIEKLLASVDEHDWAHTQFENPSALPAENLRTTAGEMLEVTNWAEVNQSLLLDMSLDEILHAYHEHHAALGNPPPDPEDAALLRALIFDTVLADATVMEVLETLTSTDGEQKDTDHDR